MFLRIDDKYNIQKKKGFLQFLKAKRKHQEVMKFRITNEGKDIEFFEEELETKMIPKNEIEGLDVRSPLILIVVGNHFLFFQDINNSINFLTISNDGQISKIPALELSDDDDILIYDETENDYLIESVKIISFYCYADIENFKEDKDFIKTMNGNRQKVLDELSKYIIHSNNGLIINNIMII